MPAKVPPTRARFPPGQPGAQQTQDYPQALGGESFSEVHTCVCTCKRRNVSAAVLMHITPSFSLCFVPSELRTAYVCIMCVCIYSCTQGPSFLAGVGMLLLTLVVGFTLNVRRLYNMTLSKQPLTLSADEWKEWQEEHKDQPDPTALFYKRYNNR